jgi:anti-sigma factor RsiW
MNCYETEGLLHGLLDDEVDPENAYRIESHLGDCARCAGQLRVLRVMRERMAKADLRFTAPPELHTRIKTMLLSVAAVAAPSRRTLFRGFAFGSALSAAAAALLLIAVTGPDQDRVVVSDVVSAHLRSLEANRLIDVQTGDQEGVKPWLGSRLGAAPPVPDLTAQGFSLVGGRIDYVLGTPVAAIVYRRSGQFINLFVAQRAKADRAARVATMQGVNVDLWSEKGFNLCAVGDVSADELEEFRKKFEAAAWAAQI